MAVTLVERMGDEMATMTVVLLVVSSVGASAGLTVVGRAVAKAETSEALKVVSTAVARAASLAATTDAMPAASLAGVKVATTASKMGCPLVAMLDRKEPRMIDRKSRCYQVGHTHSLPST